MKSSSAPGFASLFAVVSLIFFACGTPQISDMGGGGTRQTPAPTDTPDAGKHHPNNFGDSAVHGPAALFVTEDCNSAGCHGTQLEGVGTAPGCDSCHTAGWRTTCTFCHGGTDNATGAPPRDIDGQTVAANLIFRAHTQHVTPGATHVAYACTECHVKPADALSPEHWFDATHGVPEVTFNAGLNATGTFNYGTRTCATNYCHGNGRAANGSVSNSSSKPACDGCHPFLNSSATAWSAMSGKHRLHLGRGFTCNECHAGTVDTANAIADVTLHVNKQKDTKFTGTNVAFNANAKTCTGSCHGFNHGGETW